MRIKLRSLMALSLPVALLSLRALSADDELSRGIALVQQGRYEQSLPILRQAIASLSAEGSRAPLARAHFYLGLAYVALAQRDEAAISMDNVATADCSFRAEPKTPRLATDLLHASLQRICGVRAPASPSPSPQAIASTNPSKGMPKALVLGGGAALVAGAVAVAAGGSSSPGQPTSQVTPTPVPTPTPSPSLAPLPSTVTPTNSGGPGEISYRSAVPPPGSTLSNCRTMTDCRINLILFIRSTDRRTGSTSPTTSVFIYDPSGRECFYGRLITTFFNAGEGYSVEIPVEGHSNQGCSAPTTVTRMVVRLESSNASPVQQDFQIAYHVQP